MASASRDPFSFASSNAKFVKRLGTGSLTVTVDKISEFIVNAESKKKSEKIEIDGIKWFLHVGSSSEDQEQYLTCFLVGIRDGTWHRWLDADFFILNSSAVNEPKGHYSKSLVGSLPVPFHSCGSQKFIEKKALSRYYVKNDSMTITVDFTVGVDVFSEHLSFSDAKFIVQGRSVYAHKGYLSVMSSVMGTMFSKNFKEATAKDIPLEDTSLYDFVQFLAAVYPTREPVADVNVMGLYRLAHFYDVQFLIDNCEGHLLKTTGIPVIDKLLLAEELERDEFCSRVVSKMTVSDVKAITTHEKRKELSVDLLNEILKKYVELRP